MKKNLVILSQGFGTHRIFEGLYKEKKDLHVHSKNTLLNKNDVLIFEGGTDISPSFYGEKANGYTQAFDRVRDVFEQKMFNQAKELGIPMVGICRGAQLLCALSGGKLVQHVNNHGHNHAVVDCKGRSFMMTSSHHQMMLPGNIPHKMLAATKLSTIYLGEGCNNLDVKEDAEIVWFEDTKALAIQGHPEWMSMKSEGVQIVREFFQEFILN